MVFEHELRMSPYLCCYPKWDKAYTLTVMPPARTAARVEDVPWVEIRESSEVGSEGLGGFGLEADTGPVGAPIDSIGGLTKPGISYLVLVEDGYWGLRSSRLGFRTINL